jgi:hypothetical protein
MNWGFVDYLEPTGTQQLTQRIGHTASAVDTVCKDFTLRGQKLLATGSEGEEDEI